MIVFQIILISLCVSIYQCRLPDKVYCVDQECSEPISKAKTVLAYNSGDADLISFRGNADAKIYQKSAGTNPDLWYADINGVKGFVNSRFLREYKIFEKSPKFIVAVEVKTNHEVQPDKVQQAHEVFEGTTLFNSEVSTPAPQDSTTFKPVEATTPSLAELQQDPVQHFHDNNSINVPSEESNNVIMQSVSDIPTYGSSETLPNNQDDKINQSTENNIALASITTENPVETVGSISSNEQLLNIAQINPELPPQNPEPPLPPIVPSSSENFVPSENSVEIADRVNYLQQNIQKPEAVDNNELNTSIPSNIINNVDNKLPPTETSSETNIPPQNIYVTPPPSNENVQTPQVPPSIPNQYEENILNNMNYGDPNSLHNSNGMPNTNQMAAPPVLDTIPASFIDTQSVSNMNENVAIDNIKTSTEGSYFPNTETSTEATFIPNPADTSYNPISSEISHTPASAETSDILTSTEASFVPTPAETSYNPISSETTYTPVSTETNDVLTSAETSAVTNLESAAEETSQEFITSHEEAIVPAILPAEQENSKTEGLDVVTQSIIESYESTSTETLVEDVDTTTESPINVNDEGGILSNMYSTLADMWPSSTESPPPETIFNPEYMNDNAPKDAESSDQFSFMAYIISAYKSVLGSREESRALFATPGETCYKDEYCDGDSTENKNRLLTFLVTTAVSVLLFTLGYYYIDNRRQDSRLIGTINSLQRDLLFSTKECEILKEELTSTKSKLAGIEDSSFGMDDMVQSLKEEINELKAQNERLRNSLDDNEKLLRVSENTASELQNTLSEVENTLSELLAERANTEEQIAELNGITSSE